MQNLPLELAAASFFIERMLVCYASTTVMDHTPLAQPQEAPWHLGKRILFRFAFCYIVLYYLPTVLGVILGSSLPPTWYNSLWNRTIAWIFVHLLNLDTAQVLPHPTGSGDTELAYFREGLTLILAIAGGTLWTFLDRRRPNYIHLHGW